jgi:hypothetical protein
VVAKLSVRGFANLRVQVLATQIHSHQPPAHSGC